MANEIIMRRMNEFSLAQGHGILSGASLLQTLARLKATFEAVAQTWKK
jgi:hypothetical protein